MGEDQIESTTFICKIKGCKKPTQIYYGDYCERHGRAQMEIDKKEKEAKL